tara:strand:+ start:212 stop:505 length:294 start_codon:yes stop_codon:yes gene_type:complete
MDFQGPVKEGFDEPKFRKTGVHVPVEKEEKKPKKKRKSRATGSVLFASLDKRLKRRNIFKKSRRPELRIEEREEVEDPQRFFRREPIKKARTMFFKF